jgi:glyoxylase-like metal-dependent hydrolase (beta-lactamase superfamily II)
MAAPAYRIYAVQYAHRETVASEVFYGDHTDTPVGMDYFVWAITDGDRTVVMDLGFTEPVGTRRGRQFLRSPARGLQQIGIDTAAVEHVIITHFHYDHGTTSAGTRPGCRS